MFLGRWRRSCRGRFERGRGEGEHVAIVITHGFIIALFLAVGARFPRSRGPALTRETLVNLTNGAMLAGLRFLFVASLATSAATASALPRCDLSWVRGFSAQLIVAFLLSDLTRYTLHYLHHRVEILWRFHAVHHSTVRLDATAGLRMHLVDFVQLSLVPVLLFGLLFDVSSFDPRVWPALIIITDAFDAFQHADIEMDLTRPLPAAWDRAFNNPVFHSWHHSTHPGEHNGNYGQALTIWDRLFGTHIAHRRGTLDTGLPANQRLDPTLWGLQLLRPAGARPPATEGCGDKPTSAARDTI